MSDRSYTSDTYDTDVDRSPKRKAGDISKEKLAKRLAVTAKKVPIVQKATLPEDERPICLKGAPGNLKWKEGAYFENAMGAAGIAFVATHMLRDLLYSPEQMTVSDIDQMKNFLRYVGGVEGIQKYGKGLKLIEQNKITGFHNMFGEDGTPTLKS